MTDLERIIWIVTHESFLHGVAGWFTFLGLYQFLKWLPEYLAPEPEPLSDEGSAGLCERCGNHARWDDDPLCRRCRLSGS